MASRRPSQKKATRKRSAKRTASCKPTASRADSKRRSTGLWIRALFLLLGLALVLALTYHFSPYSVRERMERCALIAINTARSPDWLPQLVRTPLDWVHDCIPNSEGMVVDGGELDHNESVWFAGVPTARTPLRTLTNHSAPTASTCSTGRAPVWQCT